MGNSKETLGHASPAESSIKTHGSDSNTTSSQRQRILKHLTEIGPVTTLEARQELDVMHPAARIMELRRRGHDIQAYRYVDCTDRGKSHRVPRYVLIKQA